MIYTTGWTREKVRTEPQYLAWLQSLKDGDEVLFQQFHPASEDGAALTFSFECWQFKRVRVYGRKLESRGDSHPVCRESGEGRYLDYKKEWGNVFPARIVPLHSDLPVAEVGKSVYGHKPVYEPLYFHNYRHHAIAKYGKTFNHNRFKHVYNRHYWKKVEGAELLIFFCDVEPKELQLPDSVNYLYSEYLAP